MKMVVVLVVLSLMLFIPTAHAQLQEPTLEFIPQDITANESLIAIVNAGSGVIRVGWIAFPGTLHGDGRASLGSFENHNGTHQCFFSCVGTQCTEGSLYEEGTCGPTPFNADTEISGVYEVELFAIDRHSQFVNTTVNVSVSDVQLGKQIVANETTGEVIMRVWAVRSSLTSTDYQVYRADDLTESILNGPMSYNVDLGKFEANITLEPGEYFIVFNVHYQGGNGGTIVHLVMEEVETPPVPACADEIDNDGDSLIDYPADPGCSSAEDDDETDDVFEGVVEADGVQFTLALRKGDSYRQSDFFIRNTGNQTLANLTATVQSDLRFLLDIDLVNTTLAPGESTSFTVHLTNVQEGADIVTNVNVSTAAEKVGEIPVRILISILGDGTAPPLIVGNYLLVNPQPPQWTGPEFIVGDTAIRTFTISNAGNTTITNITSTTNIGGLAVEGLPQTLEPGSQPANFQLSLSPVTSGTRSGTVTIESSGGSQIIFVNLEFFSDIADDINRTLSELTTLESQLALQLTSAQLQVVSPLIAEIRDDLQVADSNINQNKYGDAQDVYIEATGKAAMLVSVVDLLTYVPTGPSDGDGEPGFEIDFTILIAVVIIVAVAGVAFYFFKVRKPREKEEEAYGEEFDYEEGSSGEGGGEEEEF